MNMNPKPDELKTPAKISNAKRPKRSLNTVALACVLAAALLLGRWVWAQGLPALAIAPATSNQLTITITNPVPGSYELWTTPVLGDDEDYPWTIMAVGTNGQNSFTILMPVYPAGFYQATLDTNAIPLWEAADPNNQSTGILNIWIDSPTNGTTLN